MGVNKGRYDITYQLLNFRAVSFDVVFFYGFSSGGDMWDVLQEALIPVIANEKCAKAMSVREPKYVICVEGVGKGTCQVGWFDNADVFFT